MWLAGRMAAQRGEGRLGLVVGGGLILVLAALVATLARTEHHHNPTTMTEPSSTVTTASADPPVAGAVRASGPIEIDDGALRRADLVVVDGDDVVLVSFDGTELGRGPRGGWYPQYPDVGIDVEPGGTLVDAPAIDESLPGCGAVHGRGGIRTVVCGVDQRPVEIHVLPAGGGSRRLAGPINAVGHWRYALPSPDGRWVLAQWSGECEVPTAYLFRASGGPGRPVADTALETSAVGWTPDGRAVIGIWPGACGATSPRPGTYLLDPTSGDMRRIHANHEAVMLTSVRGHFANRLERVLSRAHEELGLDVCCNQPTHGGEDAEDGIVFEGHDIEVYAAPLFELPDNRQPEPGEVRFDCGMARYHLVDHGPTGSDDRPPPDAALLRRATARLVTRLYCATGPNEVTPP
jgi:hypothetical protein